MKVTEREEGGIAVLDLEGEADAYNSGQIKNAVNGLVEKGSVKVVINLAGLSYMDSSAIGVLVAGKTSMRNNGGDLKVCSPTRPVAKVFEITRVGSFLEVYEDEAEALAAFGS
jgi:anti-sigma B factor antagonist